MYHAHINIIIITVSQDATGSRDSEKEESASDRKR